jgi:hypothetical protein
MDQNPINIRFLYDTKVKEVLVAALAAAFFFAIPVSALAENEDFNEYVVKAGFLYSFTKFIDWPEEKSKIKDNGKFNLCLFGENPFGNILNNLAKKRKFKGADLIIKENPPSDSLKKCHILFVPKPYGNFLRSLLTIIGKTPILVVTEEEGLIYQGSGINFVIKGEGKNQIRFQINRKAVEHGGLWISSELLKLGTSK